MPQHLACFKLVKRMAAANGAPMMVEMKKGKSVAVEFPDSHDMRRTGTGK